MFRYGGGCGGGGTYVTCYIQSYSLEALCLTVDTLSLLRITSHDRQFTVIVPRNLAYNTAIFFQRSRYQP